MINEDRGVEFDINGERSSEPLSGLNFRALVWVGGRRSMPGMPIVYDVVVCRSMACLRPNC